MSRQSTSNFVSVLLVLGVRLESLRTSTPMLFFRSNETFVALFGVKMDDNNCKATRCEVIRCECREHGAPRRNLDETQLNNNDVIITIQL